MSAVSLYEAYKCRETRDDIFISPGSLQYLFILSFKTTMETVSYKTNLKQ